MSHEDRVQAHWVLAVMLLSFALGFTGLFLIGEDIACVFWALICATGSCVLLLLIPAE